MKLDLERARIEAASSRRADRKAHPLPDKVERRLVLAQVSGPVPYKDDPPMKIRVERPYLPQNRRCKRFAIN